MKATNLSNLLIFSVLLSFALQISSLKVKPQGTYDYCQAPGVVPSVNTNGKTLRMVQVVHRHGDRTPTRFMPNIEAPLVNWDCDLNQVMRPSQVFTDDEPAPVRVFRKQYMQGREWLPGNCAIGQLTSKGYDQHISLGQQFRSLYVDQYGLLASSINQSAIWIRSTDVPRTLQSAQGEMAGMYPESAQQPRKGSSTTIPAIDIHTMDNMYENMYPNPSLCPAYGVLFDKLKKSPEWQQHIQDTQALTNQLLQNFNLSTLPTWDAFVDIYRARQCNNLGLPNGISADLLDEIQKAAEWELNYEYTHPVLSVLGMSTFVAELYDRLDGFVNNNQTDVKYYLYSGHDSTIGPLMGILGQFDGKWPPYASNFELELWQDGNSNYYVQAKCNGRVLQFSGCSDVMCPYNETTSFLKSLILDNYTKTCNSY